MELQLPEILHSTILCVGEIPFPLRDLLVGLFNLSECLLSLLIVFLVQLLLLSVELGRRLLGVTMEPFVLDSKGSFAGEIVLE